MLSNFGECVQYKEIVKSSLEGLMSGSEESKDEAETILDTENLFEAQQMLLRHQVEASLFAICTMPRDEDQVLTWGDGEKGKGEGTGLIAQSTRQFCALLSLTNRTNS